MILEFLLFGLVTMQRSQPICDLTTRARYSPDVNITSVLWFCGPVSNAPDIQIWYQVQIDGVNIPSPGLLMRYFSDPLYGGYVPPPDDVSPLGRTSYISPGPIITLTSPGPHTITVTYGPDRRVESFTWVGVTPTSRGKGKS